MDHPAPPPVACRPAPTPRWLVALLGGLLALAFAVLFARHFSPHAGGADSSGYLNSARLFLRAAWTAPARIVPGHGLTEFGRMAFVPLGFLPTGEAALVPTYPPGLPLLIAGAALVVGESHAIFTVNLLTMLGTGALAFVLGRWLGLRPLLALGAGAMLGASPLFFFSAFQPMSDLSALGWTLAALAGALRARENARWGWIAGAVLSVAVLVRPTNLLVGVPVAVALGRRPRAWLTLGLGGLPGAWFLGDYQWRCYGSPFLTGYGDVGSAFGFEFVPHNLAHFARWIPVLLSPLVVAALAAPFVAAARRRTGAVLAVWAVTLVGFYAFYYHSGETWWYLRFILPAFPALILLALVVVQAAVDRWIPRWLASVLGVAAVVFAVHWEWRQPTRLAAFALESGERSYPEAARWAQARLPAVAALVCMQTSGAFFHETEFLLVRWDMVDDGRWEPLLGVLAAQQRPVFAALFAFEEKDALTRVGGRWTRLDTVGQVTFWRREAAP